MPYVIASLGKPKVQLLDQGRSRLSENLGHLGNVLRKCMSVGRLYLVYGEHAEPQPMSRNVGQLVFV
jgi:hypothetical protein